MFVYEIKLEISNRIEGIKTKKDAKNWVCKQLLNNSAFENNVAIALAANKPIGYTLLSRGDAQGTNSNLKGLLAFVSLTQADAVILMHNHTYGGLMPSNADIQIFYKTKRVLETIGVELEGMYIVNNERIKDILDWYSHKDYTHIFKEAKERFWWNFGK